MIAKGADGDRAICPRLRPDGMESNPILFWKHFRTDDPRELALRTVEFYRDHRLAAAKIMPDIPILFEDFALSSWSQVANLRHFGPIRTVGRAAEYIRTVELTRAELTGQDLILVTIFSPLALVGLWCGPEGVREMARASRTAAHAVLWALGGVVSELAAACVQAGADGIYYSCWGQDLLSADEYREFGIPYDLAGLRGAEAAEVRILHVHGALNEGAGRYATYPVQVVGWSEVESRVSLVEGALALPGKLVMGGISETQAAPVGPEERSHVAHLREELGSRLVVAPGCSLPDDVSNATLASLRTLTDR